MAADGRIVIDTEINTKGMVTGSDEIIASARRMAKQVDSLSASVRASFARQADSIQKAARAYQEQEEKVAGLREKLEELKNQQIPTDEYRNLEAEIKKNESALDRLIEKQIRFTETGGKTNSKAFERMEYDIEQARQRLDELGKAKEQMEAKGTAFIVGGDTAAIEDTTAKLTHEESRLEEMNRSLTTSYETLRNKVNEYGEKVLSAGDKTEKTTKSTRKMGEEAKKSGVNMISSMKTLLKYSIGIRSLYALVGKLRSALVEGFKNLAQYSENTNATLSGLMSSLAQCKNALATAFDPILQAVAPALNYLINLVTAAATAVAQLIAILTGKGTFIKATKVQKDYAKALKGTGGAAKEAEGALASFDKLNVMPDQNAGGGGGGGGAGAGIEDMFETAEVSDSLKGIGKILADLFKPFKEAWEKDGQAVIDAAKYALSSMGELAKSVGKSFMEVWTNGTGTKVVSELLQITKNLLTVVGNIATRLNIAWNTNKVGTRIIQNIFDIFISILDTINRITASTARWAEKLDFTPLLESINTLLEAVKPLTDRIGEGLEWFWNNVLLPIAGWTIEEAVPTFLNMLASAIDALNKVIDALKPAATWFWDNFLEPVGKWTGGAIISAMEKITELLEKFAGWVTENKDSVSQFAAIVGTLSGAFIGANAAIGIVSAALPILSSAIAGVVSVITGPIGIIFALAAMVVAAGNGEEMLKNLKEALKGLGEIAAGVFSLDWERAWSGAKQAVTGAIDAIKLAIESAMQLIDRLMGKAESLGEIEITENKNRRSTNVKTAQYGFKSLPRMAQGYSSQPVRLPRLASGTVVPPRAGEFAAILGDNRRETEVVSPLSTIKQALVEAMVEAGGMGGGNITAKIYLDSRELGRSTVNFVRDEKNRTGQNPLLV